MQVLPQETAFGKGWWRGDAEVRNLRTQSSLDVLRQSGRQIEPQPIEGHARRDAVGLTEQLKATVDFAPSNDPPGIHVSATVKVSGQTGVEMEALTAVSVACLTIYDMLKAADKDMIISAVRLLEKSGGRSGHYSAKI